MNIKKDNIPDEHVELCNLLFENGGDTVCFPGIDEDEEKIIKRGLLFHTDGILMNEGAQSQCHRNSALCWEANVSICDICTGYALSDDGIWRQHSWCIKFHSTRKINWNVVETTEARIAYFGYALTRDEAEIFLFENE